MHLLKGMLGLAAFGFAVWTVYKEIGTELVNDQVFWALLLTWAYMGFGLWLSKWDDLGKKTSEDKMDDLTTSVNNLIAEIKKDREIKSK